MKPASLPREKERAMKHGTIIIVSLMLLLGLGGCKRNAANDPGGDGPAAYQITLKGTANPSTLFIPTSNSEAQSVITIRAIQNTGAPVVGRDVYLTRDTEIGYFGNYRGSMVRPTDSNGEVQVLYIIPAGTPLPSNITMNIQARIYDDTRLDNPISEIYDIIPMQIMAAEYKEVMCTLRGYAKLTCGEGIYCAMIELKDAVTGFPIITLTRESGSWDATVPYGWTGTITATKSGFSFTPTTFTFDEDFPVTGDMNDLTFYADNPAAYGALEVDTSELNIIETAGIVANTATTRDVGPNQGPRIFVTNSLNDNNIEYTISSSNPSWLKVSTGTGQTGSGVNSYGSFIVYWEANTVAGAIQRSGIITITSITPGLIATETFTVTQSP